MQVTEIKESNSKRVIALNMCCYGNKMCIYNFFFFFPLAEVGRRGLGSHLHAEN